VESCSSGRWQAQKVLSATIRAAFSEATRIAVKRLFLSDLSRRGTAQSAELEERLVSSSDAGADRPLRGRFAQARLDSETSGGTRVAYLDAELPLVRQPIAVLPVASHEVVAESPSVLQPNAWLPSLWQEL
jgi:hypothetical protein